MTWILVAIGGALGSVVRHALNRLVHDSVVTAFPVGIFLVNVMGSAAIGLIVGAATSGRWSMSAEARIFLVVGVLGGFTTFSSFSADTLALARSGQVAYAVVNVAGQVGASLVAVWLGFVAGTRL